MMERYVTVSEAAAMLHISRQRVHQLIAAGHLKPVEKFRTSGRHGFSYLISRKAVLAAQRKKPTGKGVQASGLGSTTPP